MTWIKAAYPKKSLGQHFLRDPRVRDRLVQAIDPKGDDFLVEIGPGEGVLTEALASSAGRLIAIEIDPSLALALSRRLPNVEVIVQDVLEVDFSSLGENLKVAGNLPYYISTPILFHLLKFPNIASMHFLLQKEVAERLASPPGSRIYGRLSVMVQEKCEVKKGFLVKPGSFFPPPKVDSMQVSLYPCPPRVPLLDEELFSRLVRLAFSKRRKMLKGALFPEIKEETLERAGLDPCLRPEAIPPEGYVRLANILALEKRVLASI